MGTLILNCKDLKEQKIRSYRTCRDQYITKRVEKINEKEYTILDEYGNRIPYTKIPTTDGLVETRMSGSAQFNIDNLRDIIEDNGKNIIIVDLREEPHAFIKGDDYCYPISYYGIKNWHYKGLDWKEVEDEEHNFLDKLRNNDALTINFVKRKNDDKSAISESDTITFTNFNIISEREVVRNLLGVGYVRIAVTDHMKPENDDGDTIKIFFDSLPDSVHKHYHCAGGKGRTTTMMVINDMRVNHNNPNLSFEDFVVRQWLIGGANLFKISKIEWKKKVAEERLYFLRVYYRYIKETHNGDRIFFRTWLRFNGLCHDDCKVILDDKIVKRTSSLKSLRGKPR